jgi:hypothetical protein
VDQQDPSQLRISDNDRHRVAEFLRQAAGDGRIDLTELDERLEQTYAAKTYADLVPITADLPAQERPGDALPAGLTSQAPAQGGTRYDTSVAIMSGQDRRGLWVVGPHHNAFALMGAIVIDLRQATFTTPEVVINASAIMGSVSVIVNARTGVVVEGVGVMGSYAETRARVQPELGPGSPVVRVRGLALMGSVDVSRKPMPGEKLRRLRGR